VLLSQLALREAAFLLPGVLGGSRKDVPLQMSIRYKHCWLGDSKGIQSEKPTTFVLKSFLGGHAEHGMIPSLHFTVT